MDTKRSREEEHGREQAARAELRRRRARRSPDGALKDLDPADVSEDVRSVVMQLTDRVDQLSGELDRAKRRTAELETLADEDVLLPVLNRRGFMRELGRTISFIERYQPLAALIHVHVVGLKAINESYGHEAGDAVLADVAARLKSTVRASDIIGRVAGDEFGIILWAATEREAMRKAGLLASQLAAQTVTDEGVHVSVRAIAGATAIHAEDTTKDILSRAATCTESAVW